MEFRLYLHDYKVALIVPLREAEYLFITIIKQQHLLSLKLTFLSKNIFTGIP